MFEYNVALEVGFLSTLVVTQLTVEDGLPLTLVALVARQGFLILVHSTTNTARKISYST